MRHWIFKTTLAFTVAALLATGCTSEADENQGADATPASNTASAPNRVVPPRGANRIDLTKTQYQRAVLNDQVTGPARPACAYEGDNILRVGGLLPETGKLSYLEPAQTAAIFLAMDDIKRGGGITDIELEFVRGDSGADGRAVREVRRHIENNVDVIIGAPSSTINRTVISEVSERCRLQISGASTAADLSTLDVNDLFFRTAPSDRLQGKALADLVSEDGATKVALIAEDGSYGQQLAAFTTEALQEAGVEVEKTDYNTTTVDFSSVSDNATQNNPEAVIIIGFAESGSIVAELLRRGIPTEDIFLSDGNAGDALGERFDQPGELTGIRGVLPGAEVSPSFQRRMVQKNPEISTSTFGPETYDALIIVALAAELAGSDSAPLIAAQLNGVTEGGIRCTTFRRCKDLIEEGEDIDYDGFAGPLSFNRSGEPTDAVFAIVEFG